MKMRILIVAFGVGFFIGSRITEAGVPSFIERYFQERTFGQGRDKEKPFSSNDYRMIYEQEDAQDDNEDEAIEPCDKEESTYSERVCDRVGSHRVYYRGQGSLMFGIATSLLRDDLDRYTSKPFPFIMFTTQIECVLNNIILNATLDIKHAETMDRIIFPVATNEEIFFEIIRLPSTTTAFIAAMNSKRYTDAAIESLGVLDSAMSGGYYRDIWLTGSIGHCIAFKNMSPKVLLVLSVGGRMIRSNNDQNPQGLLTAESAYRCIVDSLYIGGGVGMKYLGNEEKVSCDIRLDVWVDLKAYVKDFWFGGNGIVIPGEYLEYSFENRGQQAVIYKVRNDVDPNILDLLDDSQLYATRIESIGKMPNFKLYIPIGIQISNTTRLTLDMAVSLLWFSTNKLYAFTEKSVGSPSLAFNNIERLNDLFLLFVSCGMGVSMMLV